MPALYYYKKYLHSWATSSNASSVVLVIVDAFTPDGSIALFICLTGANSEVFRRFRAPKALNPPFGVVLYAENPDLITLNRIFLFFIKFKLYKK